MTTNTTPTFPPARRDPRQVPNTLKRVLNFNDADVAAAPFVNSLPAGAVITKILVVVLTVFNGGSTNTLKMGQNGSFNDMIGTADVLLTALGSTEVTRGLGLAAVINSAVDVAPTMVYAQTGTPATTGKALVLVEFEGGWAS